MTSKNEYIYKFIQEVQLNARNHWDYEKQDWKRHIDELDEHDYKDVNNPKIKNSLQSNDKYGFIVVLKSLINSSNVNDENSGMYIYYINIMRGRIIVFLFENNFNYFE
ncbi:hypothetical protein C1645_838480 [Glomus cerebriforme]|uniref:Uncharacterized protein n=1 Tax=Glomus cerebriforme TaxID=658196 RepID=A0A397S505_9GLOM|nr:hypothetical protein C1645_838480 [Glomus cerebriforme]